MRTFIAVDLDSKIKDSLLDLISRLSRKGADVRWVKKQGMHITLKFLGEIPETKIPNIRNSIQRACDAQRSFSLSFQGTGSFPPQHKFPRVLWAGIEQSHSLSELHETIEDELEKLDFPRERRRFQPHLTLGRVKSNKNISAVLEELNDHRESNFGSMHVQRVTFFKSTLKPSGAEYDVLSDFQLT